MIETWINIILNILIALFLLIGTFFIISSAIGIIRFPDVYTKLHAATKAPTLGIASILIGSFLFLYVAHGVVSGKLLLAIVFILLTSPVGGHMLSRAAHHAGVKPVTKNQPDAYAKALQQKNLENEK
ncbi:MAG TPA: monovalent cation/H(+) antiporter subunit G [Bacillota bacterium]|nr:monovalent cation/H(+) antiporter subunit G [Bacillota bacterium]